MKSLPSQIKLLTTLIFAGTCALVHGGTEMTKDTKDMKDVASYPSDAGLYVAAYGGAQFMTDYGNNHQTNPGGGLFGSGESSTEIHSFWGGVGGLKVGYNFNSFEMCNSQDMRLQLAVEAEALYIGNNSHASDLAGGGSYQSFTSNSGAFFINGIGRFKNKSIVTPYMGLGFGFQDISTHGYLRVPGTGVYTGMNTNDIDPAIQGLFGFDIAVCRHVSIFTEYKFIDAFTEQGVANNVPASMGGGSYRFVPSQIQQHLITAGVKYSF